MFSVFFREVKLLVLGILKVNWIQFFGPLSFKVLCSLYVQERLLITSLMNLVLNLKGNYKVSKVVFFTKLCEKVYTYRFQIFLLLNNFFNNSNLARLFD